MTTEFEMLESAAEEVGLELKSPPVVERIFFENKKTGRKVSALLWGTGSPEVVLFHGGAQNAHTWDIVAMALERPVLAIDLPGHGHSDWREDHNYTPHNLAEDVVSIVRELAPDARAVAGMSLGGLTSIMLADLYPELVRRLMLIDITPGVTRAKAEPILEFILGPTEFESFEEILGHTVKHNPTRSEASLIRGIKNNAKEIEDGKWMWRWDPTKPILKDLSSDEGVEATSEVGEETKVDWNPEADFKRVWEALERVGVPLILYRAMKSGVVEDDDVAEFLRCQPEAEVVEVPDAGHSIQGDKPLELAGLITDFIS